MATGVIEKTYDKREARKQVLVVVTSGWSVMCFDHNLKKLWEENLQVHQKICIALMMDNHQMYQYFNYMKFCFPLCTDYNFLFFWQKDFPHNAHHREIAISVSNYTLRHGDAGLVIVGGRMEMQPHV